MLAGAARAAADVPCSGAAARDTERHCTSHRLRFRVVPTPADALLEVSRSCVTTEVGHLWWVCASGAEAHEATSTVALIGDSHAAHFGPARPDGAHQTALPATPVVTTCPTPPWRAAMIAAKVIGSFRETAIVVPWWNEPILQGFLYRESPGDASGSRELRELREICRRAGEMGGRGQSIHCSRTN